MTAEAPLAPGSGVRRGGPAPAGRREDADLALAPVVDTLVASYRRRAALVRDSAEEDVRVSLAAARAAAGAEVASARAAGRRAADRAAAVQLAAARREARALVLAAHRRAYEALRSRAIEILGRQLMAPEGRPALSDLGRLVGERVGSTSARLEEQAGSWRLVAERGDRRAEMDPAVLVEPLLATYLARLVAP